MRTVDTKCSIKSQKCSDCQRHRSTNDASASRANTAGWQKHEHSGQQWHTKHQTVGAVNGATRLTPEISAPKGGLAAEHRRNTTFSHILTGGTHASQSKAHLEAYVGPGPSAGHPIPGWGRLPPPAFGQHSGQGCDDLQLNTHRVSEGNEKSAVSATSSREEAFDSCHKRGE